MLYDIFKYTRITTKTNNKTEYYEKVRSARENFSNFLRDDDIDIDYEYLWDIFFSHL